MVATVRFSPVMPVLRDVLDPAVVLKRPIVLGTELTAGIVLPDAQKNSIETTRLLTPANSTKASTDAMEPDANAPDPCVVAVVAEMCKQIRGPPIANDDVGIGDP